MKIPTLTSTYTHVSVHEQAHTCAHTYRRINQTDSAIAHNVQASRRYLVIPHSDVTAFLNYSLLLASVQGLRANTGGNVKHKIEKKETETGLKPQCSAP